jgi:putative oxidoreductase
MDNPTIQLADRLQQEKAMRYTIFEQQRDGLILVGRILLMILFVISGWGKLTNLSSTIAYMTTEGVPLPTFASGIAVFMELFVGISLVVGFYTRPLALLFTLFVLATALVGHHYWTMPEPARGANMLHFYKNLSIIGGLLLLAVTGAGKYSVDRK